MRQNLLRLAVVILVVLTVALAACKKEDPKVCELGTTTGCKDGQICEAVATGGDPICADPVEIVGQVTDAATAQAVVGALVVAIDANGAARTTVVATDAMGNYTLPIAVARSADGKPTMDAVTLRVSAAGYQTFPTPPRPALPIALGAAVAMDGTYRVDTANTDVTLFATGVDAGAVATLTGHVTADDPTGVLVLAVQADRSVASAITDHDGKFTLFDVPRNVATTVEGYRAGLAVTPAMVTATGATLDGIVLDGATTGVVTVTGTVQIVNAPGGLTTSVILVPEAAFDEVAIRGEAPSGLRAAPVSGAFSIAGVAPGTYVVLAAYENDQLVRDPDLSISGTDIVRITIPQGAASPFAIAESFKVTEALAVISPGAATLDVVMTATPKFEWDDDSSEDGYELYLYDQFGALVHENKALPSHMGSGNPSYTLPSSVVLKDGFIYQFRVYSFRDGNNGRSYISASEDLRGVFEVALP